MLHHAKVKVCINYLVKPEKIQTFPSDLSKAAYLNFRRMGRIFFPLTKLKYQLCFLSEIWTKVQSDFFLSLSLMISSISMSCPKWMVWPESMPVRPVQLTRPFWMFLMNVRYLVASPSLMLTETFLCFHSLCLSHKNRKQGRSDVIILSFK